MIHELRIYHCMPGRLGDLNHRFANVTLKIWEKHGIRQVGFWTVLIGPSNHALYYMLEWESLAERERIWNAFASDPEWLTRARQDGGTGAAPAPSRELHACAYGLFEDQVAMPATGLAGLRLRDKAWDKQ